MRTGRLLLLNTAGCESAVLPKRWCTRYKKTPRASELDKKVEQIARRSELTPRLTWSPHLSSRIRDKSQHGASVLASVLQSTALGCPNGKPMSGDSEVAAPPTPAERKLGGLLVRKPRWGLSLPAKLLVSLSLILAGVAIVSSVYPFLAVTQRVNADVLVVEGWVHPYGIRAGVEEFRNGNYQKIYTTGGPVVGKGGYINDWNTSASVGAEELKRAGVAPAVVQMVPSRVIGRDRTYSSAVALREWWDEHGMRPHGIYCDRRHACATQPTPVSESAWTRREGGSDRRLEPRLRRAALVAIQ